MSDYPLAGSHNLSPLDYPLNADEEDVVQRIIHSEFKKTHIIRCPSLIYNRRNICEAVLSFVGNDHERWREACNLFEQKYGSTDSIKERLRCYSDDQTVAK